MVSACRTGVNYVGLVLVSAGVCAQGTTGLELSFSNPGARAMGFGGAFLGLADDATAAYANPAGLVQLTRPEVSLEGRAWSYDTPFTLGGRASGQPTGRGIDTAAGLRRAVSTEEARDLSFLSLVYPYGRWSLALYRHQLASFRSRFTVNGLFAESSEGSTVRLDDARSASRLDHVAFGLSAGYRVSDRLSVGLGLSRVTGSVEIVQETFRPDDDTDEAFFAPSSFLPGRSIGTTELLTDDVDWTLLAGFLWRIAGNVSLGGVYRQGPAFGTDAIARAGPAFDPDVPPGSERRFRTVLQTPDVYGLGLAARLMDGALTLGLDWVRVEYSDLLDGLGPELFTDLPLIDDGNEIHGGLEWVFLPAAPLIALRAGAWLDPDHRFRAAPGTADPFQPALFRGGSDEVHLAVGLGLAFRTFQLDVGADFSELVDTVSISMIYPF